LALAHSFTGIGSRDLVRSSVLRVEIRLALEEVETARQMDQPATDKRMDVIGRKIAVAGEELEYLHVAVGEARDDRRSAVHPAAHL